MRFIKKSKRVMSRPKILDTLKRHIFTIDTWNSQKNVRRQFLTFLTWRADEGQLATLQTSVRECKVRNWLDFVTIEKEHYVNCSNLSWFQTMDITADVVDFIHLSGQILQRYNYLCKIFSDVADVPDVIIVVSTELYVVSSQLETFQHLLLEI